VRQVVTSERDECNRTLYVRHEDASPPPWRDANVLSPFVTLSRINIYESALEN
jgi:hypothetical protein